MSATTETISKPTIPASALELVSEADSILAEAKNFTVENDRQYEMAGIDLKRIKDKQRELDQTRKSITRPLDAAKRQVMDFFRRPEAYLKDAERILKRAMLTYQDEKQRKAREEEARLRELQRQEQERLAREAEELEKAGDKAAASAVIEQAATMPDPIVQSSAPKVDGIKRQTRWSAELVDKMALIKAVAEGQVPDIALDANMTFLNQQARSLKGAFNIPGVRATEKTTLAA